MRNVTKMLRKLMLVTVSMFVFVTLGFSQQTMLLTESFETGSGTTPPAGWALEQVTGTTLGVTFVTTSTYPTISAAYDGTKFVQYNSFNISSGSTRLKRTTAVSTTNKSFAMVDFAWYEDPGYSSSADKVDVQWSTDGTTWNTAGTFNRYNAVAGWKVKNVVLPAGANNVATLYVAFLFTSAYGNNCAMDLVHVTVGPAAPPAFATIGNGSVSSNYPYTTYWMGGRTQMLFTAAELTAAGVPAGNLTSIGFNVISNSTQVMNNFSIKMGHTTATSSTATYASTTGFTQVYNTPYAVPGTGWRDITLTTPFVWNGTSNVLIDICYANTSYTSYSPVNSTAAANMTTGYYADVQTACSQASGTVQANRPNIRFGVPPITPGVLMGYVKDVNTLAPIAGAIVQVGALRDTSRANGMYIIYNLNAGAVTANTTAAGYIANTTPATIVGGAVTNLDIMMAPGPKVGGVVTDASTGLPIVGATIKIAGTVYTMSVAGGTYLTPLLSIVGTQTIEIAKTGYDNFTGTVNLVANTTTTQDAALLPTAVQPGPFTAALNGPPVTGVNLNWGIPQGLYQVIYDDGIQDNFAIWANANNLNALKFTPLGWPAKLVGGKVNLGTAANYPANALPLAKFKMLACKADGAGGTPGTIIDSVEVTPTGFGWADFSFSIPLTINSGDFFLVMRQGGIPPHAAGIGVDLTSPQLRSWSKFVTGGAPWVPAAGNFQIRAIMQGIGGPLLGDNLATEKNLITASAPEGLIYESPVTTQTGYEGKADYMPFAMTYQVWRLLQGQEGNQAAWTSIWTGSVNTAVDNGWPSLGTGAYRWAVKAIYSPPGQRPSAPTFSNVLGKDWLASVNVCISLTCAANPKAGTLVKLINADYPDTNYTKTTDTAGCVHFTNVWKGNYQLQVVRFTYPVYTQNVVIQGGTSNTFNFNVVLLQETAPPTNLVVNDQSLKATWSPPRAMVVQLNETFTNFTTNQWVVTGGTNWGVTTGFGNPAPSAQFSYSPTVTNYHQYLTSKSLAGIHAPIQRLKYDIYLSNYGTTNLNEMTVELWNGTTWTPLKNYQNTGNIPWTSENLDISSVTHNPAFKIRFHASGVDSYDINNWNIDNVQIYSTDGTSGPNPCVIGYNFYLNNVLSAFTPDTTYNIPPNQVVYGTNYQACVKAVYGSGYSPQICVNFTAHFLYPARDLTAVGVPECNAYLAWKKPVTMGDFPDFHVPAFQGTVDHTTPDAGRAPVDPSRLNSNQQNTTSTDSPLGSTAFGCDAIASPYKIVSFDINNLNGMTQIVNNPLPDFMSGFVYPPNETTWGYCMAYGQNILYKMTVATGAITTVGPLAGLSGGFAGITVDPNSGIYYGSMSSGSLYKFDPVAMTATLIGTYGGVANLMIGISCDAAGNLWGHDIGSDNFFSIDKLTGAATVVGPLGFNANYAQSEFYDQTTNKVILGAYNLGTSGTEIRAVDVTTGASVVLSSGVHEITAAGIPFIGGGGGGGTPAGLIGYNIYRDGTFIHYNPHQDSITYYDYALNPGTYKYEVKAKYDLTTYGFPGQTGLSLGNTAGEKTVNINCGRPLPFYEPWDLGTFAFNNWSFAPSQGHWSMNTGLGNPAPSADFIWSPAIANYSTALVGPVIDATPWTCAKIWLDVDLKLVDRNNTGKEKLTVDLFYNGSWHQKLELSNNGSTEWMPKHIDISVVKGKSFRIRFNATGVNSADMLHWYVDNVHAYGICTPATALHATQSHFTTTLTWTAPNCVGTIPTQLKKLFQWSGTPDNGYFQAYGSAYGVVYDLATYPDASLNKIDFHHASWGTTGIWQYKIHVVDWTTFVEIATLGPLSTTGDDKWENNVTLGNIPGVGGKLIGIMLEPLSNSPTDAYPCFSADNVGPDGVSVFGPLPNYAGFAASAIGDFLQNLWIEIPLGDKPVLAQPRKVTVQELQNLANTKAAAGIINSTGFLYTNQMSDSEVSDSSVLTGYNVYRTNELGVNFAKLAGPITATTYVDTYPSTLVTGNFKYYVSTLYKNSADNTLLCESPSDTIAVHFPAVGMDELTGGQIMIYPNPATEVVNVKSDFNITRIDVMNFVGQTIYTSTDVASQRAKISVVTFKPGVYFVKISTSEGIRTVKITVTH